MGKKILADMKNMPLGVDKLYTVITDLNRSELFKGLLNVDKWIHIPSTFELGDEILVTCDNFTGENDNTFSAASGYGVVVEDVLYLSDRSYITLDNDLIIPENADFRISMDINSSNVNSYEGILESDSGDQWFRFLPLTQTAVIQGYINNKYFGSMSLDDVVPRDGNFFNLVIKRTNNALETELNGITYSAHSNIPDSFSIRHFAKFKSTNIEGFMRNISVEVEGVTVLNLPVDNPALKSRVMSTIGSNHATITNFEKDDWKTIDVLGNIF